MCFKEIGKKIGAFCVIGFVVGIMFAFIMPPIVIAIIEGILLVATCIYFFVCC